MNDRQEAIYAEARREVRNIKLRDLVDAAVAKQRSNAQQLLDQRNETVDAGQGLGGKHVADLIAALTDIVQKVAGGLPAQRLALEQRQDEPDLEAKSHSHRDRNRPEQPLLILLLVHAPPPVT